ncbi:MAG: pyruvate kinase [Proteobacteria bacterium]|jgi:pyruvate kinase|nr:pyruvate kinase [Pseudomonadota bacterium]
MLADRRVKIVATIGPSTQAEESLERAIRSGMNVARLNFSHGSHEDHLKVIQRIRKLSQKLKAPITVLQDLQGPKIRVGKFESGKIELKVGEQVTITMKSVMGRPGLIPSDFLELAQSVKPGVKILLDDGLLELKVLSVSGDEVLAEVIYGGFLKDRKGMNLPGVTLHVDCLTAKDLEDLEFGLANNVDYVALSFVRHAKDIRKLRELIEAKNPGTKICAKIEMIEAIDNLEEIVRLSDAVMVARGDLAVEVGQSRLPEIQKRIIKLCNQLNKPVITATQMLESMVENPRPTRAEITDVANAVLDGSDALMLSAESASGKYPFKCIQTMNEIIREVEQNTDRYYKISLENEFLSVAGAIAASASLSALKLDAKVIVCLSTTGRTANIISGFRPRSRIVAVTDNISALNKLELVWGIQTLLIGGYSTLEDVTSQVERMLIQYGLAKTGDKVVMTLGQPILDGAKTNNIYIFTLGGEGFERLADSEIPLRCQKESSI